MDFEMMRDHADPSIDFLPYIYYDWIPDDLSIENNQNQTKFE